MTEDGDVGDLQSGMDQKQCRVWLQALNSDPAKRRTSCPEKADAGHPARLAAAERG